MAGKLPRKEYTEDEARSLMITVSDLVSQELENIGLDKARKLERHYGKDDLRVKKAKMEAFLNAYSILGTVKFAAQVCGLNPRAVQKVIKNNEYYQKRFETAHDEFCQYLEQTAIVRALQKSDSLLSFLLRANNPRKFSERMRIQALTDDGLNNSPVELVFGEYGADWDEPNYLTAGVVEDDIDPEEETDIDQGQG